jgi:hypothetical protein
MPIACAICVRAFAASGGMLFEPCSAAPMRQLGSRLVYCRRAYHCGGPARFCAGTDFDASQHGESRVPGAWA